jgi:hypothetical protein
VEPVVEKGLATAGLGLRKVNAAPEMLQELRHRHPDVRVELVGQAGNKQRNVRLGHGVQLAER